MSKETTSAPSTVLVTGSSSGIGLLTAALFAERGWNVAATARDPRRVTLTGDRIVTPVLDVTDETTIAAAVNDTVHRFGRIDVVVNNAGFGVFGPLEAIPAATLREQIETNVLGVASVLRHVLPVMRRQGGGTIVNVSSLGGRMTTPYLSAYYASKFALEGLSESMRYELEPHGIRVKLVEPAHFKTDFITRSLRWATHAAYEPQSSNMRAWVERSAARAPSAEPVAEMIVKAATDSSRRLRYPVHGTAMRVLHAILPDRIWYAMLAGGMHRRPPETDRSNALRSSAN